MQASVEMPPLGHATILDQLESGTDTEATQNQTSQEETQTQENVETSDQIVKLMDFQHVPGPPIQMVAIGISM